MKAALSLLALAASALALEPANVARWGKGHETTVVTYETTTVCPVTITTTGKGTTYEITKWTTSTITVTSCPGGECGGGVVTVPGPTVTEHTAVTEYTTITSLCPITETKTVGGSTVVVTWTSTVVVVTAVPTTVDVYTTEVTTEVC
ncbi:hypothetical protein GQ53DRAFT_78425 [Thozetella sp. PMI_491]|nr:hypothetical protein GQ53DRAFT_78425 [Thozetella sp. PMI_491]